MKVKMPDDLVEELLDTRDDENRARFYSLILGAKNAGYSFSEIAEPLEVSRSAANQWHKSALRAEVEPADIPKRVEPPHDPTGIPRKITPDVPPAQREHILNTANLARKNSRWSREDSPERKASYELERLITLHIKQRKVPVASFARHAGVTRRAIMQRVEKLSNS